MRHAYGSELIKPSYRPELEWHPVRAWLCAVAIGECHGAELVELICRASHVDGTALAEDLLEELLRRGWIEDAGHAPTDDQRWIGAGRASSQLYLSTHVWRRGARWRE